MEYAGDKIKRERGTELFEIKEGLERNGKELSDILNRVTAIGNKFIDESSCEVKEVGRANPNGDIGPRLGAIGEFQNIVTGYDSLLSRLREQITKLEKII